MAIQLSHPRFALGESGWYGFSGSAPGVPVKQLAFSQILMVSVIWGATKLPDPTDGHNTLSNRVALSRAPTPHRDTLPAPSSDSLIVVVLGSGVGPSVNLQQYGASILVDAGGERLLFDCGRGATLRLTQLRIPPGSIRQVFLTHLHSDHIVQIPDLMLTGWAGGSRTSPLSVSGPAGTAQMMDHLQQAFSFDIHMRRDVDEKLNADGIRIVSRDITEGVVYESAGGVKVTAFLVDHGALRPALGYRIDYKGRSVALSGDTRLSENLIRAAAGVDVLIHEAIDPVLLRSRTDHPNPAVIDAIIAHHTTPQQAGQVFTRVKPRLAVYAHAPNSPTLIAQTRETYSGPLEGPEDLLTIIIGEQVAVKRFPK